LLVSSTRDLWQTRTRQGASLFGRRRRVLVRVVSGRIKFRAPTGTLVARRRATVVVVVVVVVMNLVAFSPRELIMSMLPGRALVDRIAVVSSRRS
jgi:hypothetical protein